MMAALDSPCLPVAVEIVKGSGTDADHYLPLIDRVRATLETSGHLYVGDSQLGSISNRWAINEAKDYYLCPLNGKQCGDKQRSIYISQLPDSVEDLPGIFTEEDSRRGAAHFFEVPTLQDYETVQWEERRVIVYSPAYAKNLKRSFDKRLCEAQASIEKLVIHKKGRRNPKTLEQLHTRIDRLLKKYKVEGYFEIEADQQVASYQVGRYKDRPAQMRNKITLGLTLTKIEERITDKHKQLGWQVYATNAPANQLTTEEVVQTYRNEFRIEHLFDYLINRDVGLLPVYLKKEHRVKALIRFLSLAMRFSVLIQHQVSSQLAKTMFGTENLLAKMLNLGF